MPEDPAKLDEVVQLAKKFFGAATLETQEAVQKRVELALEAGEPYENDIPFLFLSGATESDEDWDKVVDFHFLLAERGWSDLVHVVLRVLEED